MGTVALGVTSLMVAGSAIGVAATGASAASSGKVYKACLTSHHKLTHVTTGPAPTCTAAGSHLVIWNQKGPKGANGRAGQDGQDGSRGPQGPQGPQGPAGLANVETISSSTSETPDGDDINLEDDSCPQGTVAISGWGTVVDDETLQNNGKANSAASVGVSGNTWIYSSGPDVNTPGLPTAWEVDWSSSADTELTFTVYEVCAQVSEAAF
jgi:hypothetical protein